MSGPSEPLCPACARAPQTDERSGWCASCLAELREERYVERTRREALARAGAWERRALEARRRWDLERQRRHRLLEVVRPRRPAPRDLDPLEIAREALEALEALRPAAARSGSREVLEDVAEALRILAWGPVEEPSEAGAPGPPRPSP